MKRWLRFLMTGIEATIVLAVVYFEPTCGVRGTLWREATYDGKPTSYWRQELQRWDVRKVLGFSWMGYRDTVYERTSTPFERWRDRWLPAAEEDSHPEPAVRVALLWMSSKSGPRLLHDEAAHPVLRELLDDPSPKIRLFAQIGLGMNPKIPGDDE